MKNGAFTLIELIVVMAIIAVLVLLAAPRFLGYTKDAKVTAMQQDTKVLSDAVEKHHIDNGEWPTLEIIDNHGVGGVDELYKLDETKLGDSIKNIKGNYTEYGIAPNGKYEGEVFHIHGVENKDGKTKHSHIPMSLTPVVFDSVHYRT